MSRLDHAGVGEDDVNSYQVYKYLKNRLERSIRSLRSSQNCAIYRLHTSSLIVANEVTARFMYQHCAAPHRDITFLQRCMEFRRDLAMRILSVRPSVRPSVLLSNA